MIGKEVRVSACLLAGNIDNMVQFYRDAMGFHTNGMVVISQSLRQQAENHPYSCTEEKISPRQLGITTFLQKESKRHLKLPFGIRNFYVADPEGNLLEIGSTRET